MDRLMNKRNLILFIGYSAFICGCLALMNDFGTALIFFCAFLVIAFLRSGSVGTVALAIAALVFAGVVALKIAPHALRRFTSWRHIWGGPSGLGLSADPCFDVPLRRTSGLGGRPGVDGQRLLRRIPTWSLRPFPRNGVC